MRFELCTEHSYPPIIRDLSTGRGFVLTTDVETFLAQAVVDLDERINVLEKQCRLLLSQASAKTCEK